MYSIKYSYEAYLELDNFINSYKNTFIKLYTDTGIYDEKVIIKNYVDIGNKLYGNIKNRLQIILEEEIIFGRALRNIGKTTL